MNYPGLAHFLFIVIRAETLPYQHQIKQTNIHKMKFNKLERKQKQETLLKVIYNGTVTLFFTDFFSYSSSSSLIFVFLYFFKIT